MLGVIFPEGTEQNPGPGEVAAVDLGPSALKFRAPTPV
jgi:hypothetical protein